MNYQLLLAKIESEYGTDATAGAANTMFAQNVRYNPTGQFKTLNIAKPGVGPSKDHIYGEHIELAFEIPLIGSGVAGTAPKWGVLMTSCGWSETIVADTSVTYAPKAQPKGGDSLTCAWKDDLHSHLILGARGRVGLRFQEGELPMLQFNYRGLHTSAAAAAAAVPGDATWTGWYEPEPVAQGATSVTFAGSDIALRTLALECSDNVKFADRPNQELVDLLGDRAFSGNLDCSSPAVGTINFEALAKANTNSAIALTHGATAGLISTINARVQNEMPTYGRGQDDRHTSSVRIKCRPSTMFGTNELSIVLT